MYVAIVVPYNASFHGQICCYNDIIYQPYDVIESTSMNGSSISWLTPNVKKKYVDSAIERKSITEKLPNDGNYYKKRSAQQGQFKANIFPLNASTMTHSSHPSLDASTELLSDMVRSICQTSVWLVCSITCYIKTIYNRNS